ncbi:DoxX family protein [Sediminicola luteus]|uniref:DoxX family protein n=1 Tax=Sediminicola luteus TaxID=319238 RepID=A0A2A4G8B3_9FLAO|nr:DoxX family protein [Sediminicola luteus]PCE64002.1 DoxX family protein [Sediminicola luteus]
MKNLTDIGLAILRIAPSSLMLTHGIPKLQKMLGGDFAFANPLGIGEAPSLFLTVIGEVICPILIILGYKTRWAAVPAAITMFVAAFVVHASDPIDVKEKAFLYLFAFVAVIFTGPGSFSFDRK